MAQTPPTAPTPAPTPAIQRGDRATFSSRVDAFIAWLQSAPTQFAALATNVYNNAVDAFNSATAAVAALAGAQSARDAALGYVGGLLATSATANTLATGAKAFTTQAGKDFPVNRVVYLTDSNNAARWAVGVVTSYAGTALGVNIIDVAPGMSGQNVTAWNITPSGIKGGHRFDPVAVADDGVIDLQFGRNSYFTRTQAGSLSYTIVNPPPGGSSFTLELRLDAGVPGFPASVLTPENGTLTLLTGRTHIITFITSNGGTPWRLGSLRNYLNS